MAMLANTEIAGRTVVFQNDSKIMPIDHLVGGRPEKLGKPQGRKDLVYRRSINDGSGDADMIKLAGPSQERHMG